MKNTFFEYLEPNSQDLSALFKEGLITFDANVLLNLYRYSDPTRTDLLETMRGVRDRIWLTHQAALEFFRNRHAVILEQANTYTDAAKALKKLQSRFTDRRAHPFLSERAEKRFCEVAEMLQAECAASCKRCSERLQEDTIASELIGLFEDRVGPSSSEEELEQICKEGPVRYECEVPPGYRDNKKPKPNSLYANSHCYGDLVLWKQIIQKSTESQMGVILVCDDRKDDWWFKKRGKTLSPRPELLREFWDNSEHLFHMYTPDRFLYFASKQLRSKIAPDSIEEMRNLAMLRHHRRKQELAVRKRQDALSRSLANAGAELARLQERKMEVGAHLDALARTEVEDSRQYDLLQELGHLEAQMDFIRQDIISMEQRRRHRTAREPNRPWKL